VVPNSDERNLLIELEKKMNLIFENFDEIIIKSDKQHKESQIELIDINSKMNWEQITLLV
jgi:hypothetical protein